MDDFTAPIFGFLQSLQFEQYRCWLPTDDVTQPAWLQHLLHRQVVAVHLTHIILHCVQHEVTPGKKDKYPTLHRLIMQTGKCISSDSIPHTKCSSMIDQAGLMMHVPYCSSGVESQLMSGSMAKMSCRISSAGMNRSYFTSVTLDSVTAALASVP